MIQAPLELFVVACVVAFVFKRVSVTVFVNILFLVLSMCKTKGMIVHDSAGKTPYG